VSIQQPQSTDSLASPDHAKSHRVIANDDAAPDQSLTVNAAGQVSMTSISTATQKASGIHRSLSITYISGTGTAGADNTAQTIKTLVLPANTLTQVGDRMRTRAYYQATAGPNITGAVKVGPAAAEVLIGDLAVIGTGLAVVESWLHYIDNTHANIIENESGALGGLSAANAAGYTWNASQNIIFTQNAVVGQHLNLLALIVDVFPKGIV